MDHTTDEQLQSFLDHEDSDVERAAVRRHVATCARCHSRLETLEGLIADVSDAVGLLRPPPVRRPAFAALEARSRDAKPGGPAAASSNGTVPSRRAPTSAAGPASVKMMTPSWLRAAALVLAVAGAAGAATIVAQRRVLERADQSAATQPEHADPAVIADPQVARSGVSVMPHAGRIVVAVLGAAPGTTIDVGVAESGAASAFVGGDGDGIRFSAQAGRIDVDATGRAIELDVRLPASATSATVEVDGRIRARKVDGTVRVERGGRDITVRVR